MGEARPEAPPMDLRVLLGHLKAEVSEGREASDLRPCSASWSTARRATSKCCTRPRVDKSWCAENFSSCTGFASLHHFLTTATSFLTSAHPHELQLTSRGSERCPPSTLSSACCPYVSVRASTSCSGSCLCPFSFPSAYDAIVLLGCGYLEERSGVHEIGCRGAGRGKEAGGDRREEKGGGETGEEREAGTRGEAEGGVRWR